MESWLWYVMICYGCISKPKDLEKRYVSQLFRRLSAPRSRDSAESWTGLQRSSGGLFFAPCAAGTPKKFECFVVLSPLLRYFGCICILDTKI